MVLVSVVAAIMSFCYASIGLGLGFAQKMAILLEALQASRLLVYRKRYKKATNPMLMVASHDDIFYFVNEKSREVLWEHDSKDPMLSRLCIEKSGVEGGVNSTPKGLDKNHMPGNGSLVHLINLTRHIEVAEKIFPNTSFFRRSFRGHRVVVKKVPRKESEDYHSKTEEIYRYWYDLDGIVRLEFEGSDDEFHYIAFEMCAGNLMDVFKIVRDFIKHEHVNIMRELILAVKEFNQKHIIPGNVNPRSEQLSMHNPEMSNLGETLLYIMSDRKYKLQLERDQGEDWTVARKKEMIK
nr:hypothetical protein [Tanacetum cinerariifolium]